MLKNLLFFVALLASVVSYSQGNYAVGFKVGYKEGYCYGEYNCLTPSIPLTPLLKIGESYDSYKDGYNRGFIMGQEDKAVEKSNSGPFKSAINTNNSNYNSGVSSVTPISTYVSPNYDVLLKTIEIQQEAYARDDQKKKEKAIANMNQVKEYYESLKSYPSSINNGWYNVISTNNYDNCFECKVYVSNNKVTKYVEEEWLFVPISYSLEISNAKAMVQLKSNAAGNGDMVTLYFLEYINDKYSYVSPPSGPGEVCFYAGKIKRGGIVDIICLDAGVIGQLTLCFEEVAPSCGQTGTQTEECKPGTYTYSASNSKYNWSGSFTITAGRCTQVCIQEK